MNLLRVSLWRSQNFKGSILWQSFSVVTVWSDRTKARFLLWLSLLPKEHQGHPGTEGCSPSLASLCVCSSTKDCSPSTCSNCRCSNCRWKPFYSFHGNLYPALALHEIYSEIRGYFFPFVNLSQGQFKKNLHSTKQYLLRIFVLQIYLEVYLEGVQTGH